MKKISSKKPALALKKETLRNLTKGELGRINGGTDVGTHLHPGDVCGRPPPAVQ